MTEREWLEQFSENLRSIMREVGYSQTELAFDVGLSDATLSRYLSARQVPKAPIIVNLAYALNCDVEDLIDFNEHIEM